MSSGGGSKIFLYKDHLVSTSLNAVDSLRSGARQATQMDVKNAFAYFSEAQDEFSEALESLDEINILVQGLTSFSEENNKKYLFGKEMVLLGTHATQAAQNMSKAASFIFNESEDALTDRLEKAMQVFKETEPDLEQVYNIVKGVDIDEVPESLQAHWSKVQEMVPSVYQDLKKCSSVSEGILDILGHYQKKRYLLVFQNSTELRPTGGFMGSFAIMDMYKGEIKSLEIPGGGPYDLRAGLLENIKAPAPLHLVNSKWEFQDANWFADWPTSAEKIEWFYSNSGGSSVDGVIGLNIFLFEKLLSMVGPVEMPEYKMTITHDNFLERIQSYVEFEYDKEENKPKKIIGDLAPKVLNRLFKLSSSDYLDLAKILNQSLIEKDLLIYFSDPILERKMSKLGWSGEIKMANKDYLMVVNTNIAGGKTDGVIAENVQIVTHIKENGEVYNELTLSREHRGKEGNVFTGLKNIDYLRIYVPLGSKLIEADGFEKVPDLYFLEEDFDAKPDEMLLKVEKNEMFDEESGVRITEEFGKTVFAHWIQVDVGEKVEVRLVYKLPFVMHMDDNTAPDNLIDIARDWFYGDDYQNVPYYSMFVQKQPGSWGMIYDQQVLIPKHWRLRWYYPEKLKLSNGVVSVRDKIDRDKLYSFIINR